MEECDKWLAKLAKLKVDRASGDPAPHKPLLLLVLLDLAAEGALPDDLLPLSGELAFRFCAYWPIVAQRRTQKPDVRYPFHHLGTDGLWACLDSEGQLSLDRRQTRSVRIDPGFLKLVQDQVQRDKARRLVIESYFLEHEKVSLYEAVGLVPSGETRLLVEPVESQSAIEKGRSARFRCSIVAAYNFTCALTRYRLVTIGAGSLVDAAHIHQFAESRNDDARNGVALCKNAHWLFDEGLWSVTDDFRVIVAKDHFAEIAPDQKRLIEYEGAWLHLPANRQLWPDPRHLTWHRCNVFRGR